MTCPCPYTEAGDLMSALLTARKLQAVRELDARRIAAALATNDACAGGGYERADDDGGWTMVYGELLPLTLELKEL